MVRLRVLGESVVEVAGRRVGPEASTLFALLLYLSLERGTRVERRTLTELLWPEAEGEAARHCLRQTLYKLRQLGSRVEAGPSHVVMPAADVTGELLELAAGAPVDLARLRLGGTTFGEFLPGYAPAFSPRYADWLERQRAAVDAVVRRALSAALLDGRARHRWADVESVARHFLRLDPLNEEATLALAEATALTGSKAKALTMLDRYITELGPGAGDIRLPAAVLRRRIAERVPERRYSASSDACFVGRDASMEVLAGLLREARAGRGQACLIWGDAGIGKTRLAAECAKAATLGGAQLLRVGCQASDARRPLSVFVEAVPALLNLRGALGCSPTSMQYLRRLTEHDPSETGPSDAALEADFLFANVRRSIFDLVDAVAAEATLVFLVEDVHWIDRTSWDVLRGMIDWAATRPVLFLFTSRTEHATGEPDPAPALRLVRHRLPAIDPESAGALLDAVCEAGERALGDELRAWYVRVAEGNPLFLRELAREWVESGARNRPCSSLLQLIEQRVAELTANSFRLLLYATLLAKNSSFHRLEALLELSSERLLECVRDLEQSHLIEPTEDGIQVRHELISDAALTRISEGARRLVSRQISRLLESEIRATRSPALLWDCAQHFQACGNLRQVAALVHICAGHLLEIGLAREAADLFDRGTHYCESVEEKMEMLRAEANALRLGGLWRSYATVAGRIAHLRLQALPLETAHSEDELARLEAETRGTAPVSGVLLNALACLEDKRADSSHRLGAGSLVLRLSDQSGDHATALRAYTLVKSIHSAGVARSSHSVMCDLVFHSSYGDLAVAELSAELLIELEETHGTPLGLVRALRFAQVPLLRVGKFDRAYESVLKALAIAEHHKLPNATLSAIDDLATLCLEHNLADEAEHWWSRACALPPPTEDAYLESSLVYLAGRIALERGQLGLARASLSVSVNRLVQDQFTRRKLANLAVWLRAFRVEIDARERESVLQHALRLFEQLRARGGQDYNAVSIALYLAEEGQYEVAYSLLQEYATEHRRERGERPKYLASALAALGPAQEKGHPVNSIATYDATTRI